MATPDPGHQLTDQALSALEQRIAAIYRQAADEMKDTIAAYFASFAKRDAEMRSLIGTEVNGKLWTEQEYRQWRLAQIGRGARFQALRDQLAARMTEANTVAAAYINDATPGVYSLNRNYAAYTIEQIAGSVGFTLWDEATVKRLLLEQPDLMPEYPQARAVKRGIDLAWGKKQITAQVTQSILQGESLKGMVERLQKAIPNMNRDSAIRAARTAFTGAQNAGRMDSYAAADKMGIKVRKRWVATKDGRTRHSHQRLDGQTVDWDKPFSSELGKIRFPGDPRAKPANVYNCRCTVRTVEKPGIEAEPRHMRVRDPHTGKNVLVNEMTYDEWKAWVQRRQYSDIIGVETANGIRITSVSAHSLERGGERDVTLAAVTDAVTKPLHIQPVRVDEKGQKSQRFIGATATVNVNPDTGNIVTVWKTGQKTRKRYGGKG
ncbi:MAG TPA: phage head morphogenesis protein [Candidatus Agathobaculum intestinipullorum]|nr:phage head morphogenesis protein [Candidatus Agathobaculum intestinipullorum]